MRARFLRRDRAQPSARPVSRGRAHSIQMPHTSQRAGSKRRLDRRRRRALFSLGCSGARVSCEGHVGRPQHIRAEVAAAPAPGREESRGLSTSDGRRRRHERRPEHPRRRQCARCIVASRGTRSTSGQSPGRGARRREYARRTRRAAPCTGGVARAVAQHAAGAAASQKRPSAPWHDRQLGT